MAAGPGPSVETTPAAGPPGGVRRQAVEAAPEDADMVEDGALQILHQGVRGDEVASKFIGCLREASYMEALELMADESVAQVRLGLQRGDLSLAEAYRLTKPQVAELYSPRRVTDYGLNKGLLSGVALTSL